MIVAPLVGAWIESALVSFAYNVGSVAPLVGAWIERLSLIIGRTLVAVAPLVGAWIERSVLINLLCHYPRRSSCRSVD